MATIPIAATTLIGSAYRPGFLEGSGTAWVPFTLYIQYQPTGTYTKRWEIIRDIQRKAERMESDLRVTTNTQIRIVSPVAHRTQIGQKTAAFMISGFYQRPTNNNLQPVGQTTIIHSGTDIGEKTAALTRNGNYSRPYSIPTSTLTNEISGFLTTFISLSTLITRSNIYLLEYNGQKFGRGYWNIPT